jgi:hypothetical protein
MHIPRLWAEIAKGISIVFALSVILTFISHNYPFQHLNESIYNQFAVIRGEPMVFNGYSSFMAPFYNRVLFPSIFVFVRAVLHSPTDVQIFLGLRFLSFLFCLSIIYIAINRRRHSSTNDPFMVCSVVALSMVPTFKGGWVHTSDIFDLTFCFFMFLYVVEEKIFSAFFIACLTAINRETGGFAGVVYVCLTVGKQRWQAIAVRAVMLTVVPYAAAVLLRRFMLGDHLLEAVGQYPQTIVVLGQWYTGLSYLVGQLIETFERPSPIDWPSLLFAMLVLPALVFLNRRTTSEFKVRVALGFFAIIGITATFAVISEVRTSLPAVAWLIACATAKIASSPSPMLHAVVSEQGGRLKRAPVVAEDGPEAVRLGQDSGSTNLSK